MLYVHTDTYSRSLKGETVYPPEGAIPRRIYILNSHNTMRARELCESSAHEVRRIWIVSISGHQRAARARWSRKRMLVDIIRKFRKYLYTGEY